MFSGCSSLQSLDLSSFNTASVPDMNRMFSGCSSLQSLDLSSFNTASVTDMNSMFSGCSVLENIYVGDGWSTQAVTDGDFMFNNCPKLPGYDQSKTSFTMAKLTTDGGYLKKSEPVVEDFTWDATTKTGTFTMPESDVIVKVEYKSEATVSMDVTGEGGTAMLMDATFQPLAADAKVKEGERFVLYLDRQDGYDFTTTFSKGGDTKEYMQEFSEEEYKNYINYAKEKGIQVPLNGALMWVTMPDTDDEALTMTTTFAALQTYTVLYKTTGSPTEVWVRLGITENNAQVFRAVKMQPDMAMGDGTQVWSLKMQSAFNPEKVGFFTTKEAAEAEGAQTATATVSQSATDWNGVNGGQYLIIGGEARTVYAAFVTDGSKVRIYNEASATFDGTKAADKQGVSYRIAVCQGNNAGTIRTFIPTAPEGKEFGAWIAVKNQQEEIITDVRDYEISENTTFTAI
jgi:surface protein